MYLPCYVSHLLLSSIHLITTSVISAAAGSDSGKCDPTAAGITDFKQLISCQNETYVDKSLFITDPTMCSKDVLLFTRPPTFGKTLLLSTVKHYYSFQLNESAPLFSGLGIMKDTTYLNTFRQMHMHKYAVISLDFGPGKFQTFQDAEKAILASVTSSFKDHKYLLEGELLKKADKNTFEDYLNQRYNNVSQPAKSISFLTSCIKTFFKKMVPVLVIIDNYDAPIISSYLNGYYTEMVAYERDFLDRSLKQNPVDKGILAGVTKVGQECVPSNIETFTILSSRFSEYFGFTQKEVDLLTGKARNGDENMKKKLEQHYSGYHFGDATVYAPGPVVSELFGKTFKTDDHESTLLLEKTLKSSGLYPILTVQQLLTHTCAADKIVLEDLAYTDLGVNETAFWTSLVHWGYLAAVNASNMKPHLWNVTLQVPNEVAVKQISNALYGKGKIAMEIPDYHKFIDNLVSGSITAAVSAMETYIKDAGIFFRRAKDDFEAQKLQDYVTRMLRGVEARYNAEMKIESEEKTTYIEVKPHSEEGYSVYVTLQEESPKFWQNIKNKLCSVIKSIDRNRTEIVIQFTKDSFKICSQFKLIRKPKKPKENEYQHHEHDEMTE